MRIIDRRDLIAMALSAAIVLAVLMYTGPIIGIIYPAAGTGKFRLPVFETSDIHGSIVSDSQPIEYRMAYIADKVEDVRKTDEGSDADRTILVDSGDIYQGSTVSLLEKGEPLAAVYDWMKYDAVGIGNHEFDWGLENVVDSDATMRDYVLGGEKHENKVPVVCSNLYRDGEKTELSRDYVILNKKAYSEDGKMLEARVAVIGYAENYADSVLKSAFTDLGYTIVEDPGKVNEIASGLEESGECDATILLVHGDPEHAAESLGEGTAVDLLLGGHVHKRKNDVTEWGLRYLSPSGKASSFVYSELAFEHDGKGGAQLKAGAEDRSEIIEVLKNEELTHRTEANAEELTTEVMDITDEYMELIRGYLEDEIGYVDTSITRTYLPDGGKRISVANNWVNDAVRRYTGADVSICNASGVRTDLDLPEGEDRRVITHSDIFAMLPFDDSIYVYEITYGEFLDLMHYSMQHNGRSLLTCMTGIDCYFYDDPSDTVNPEGRKNCLIDVLVKDGKVIYRNGEWTEEGLEDKKLKISVGEFSAITDRPNGDMHNPLIEYNESDRLLYNNVIMRDAVLEALEEEAAENNGYLHVDTTPHFIYHKYEGE